MQTNNTRLQDLRKEINKEENNPYVKEIYNKIIEQDLTKLKLIGAAKQGDMENFLHYSIKCFGKPSVNVFEYEIMKLKTSIQEEKGSQNEYISNTAKKLDDLIILDKEPTLNIEIPDNDLFETAKKYAKPPFDIAEINNEDISPDILKREFERVLKKLELYEWNVALEDNISSITVTQSKKIIEIPNNQNTKYQKKRFYELAFHEIGTHVLRRVNGERSRLKILGLGLDHYDPGEEGIATLREQILQERFIDFSGLEGHLSISLALGLDRKPRNYREIYNILKLHFLRQELKCNNRNYNIAIENARKKAWNRACRTFRGTDCKTPGIANTVDIVYREGNIGIWKVIKDNPEEIVRFNCGKYDPANPEHINILNKLDIH